MENQEAVQFIQQNFSVWDHMTPEQREMMSANAQLQSYKKGSPVHSADKDCLGMLLIKQGVLRMYMLSEEGKEITLYRLREGDLCVLSASCVLSSITFEVYVDAEQDAQVVQVSAPVYSKLMKENIYVECFTYKLIADRFSDVMWAMQQILFMSFDKRLANFLWDELSNTQGDVIHMTHEQVAKYMGSAREVVTRMLKYFSAEGVVELSRGGIRVLDRKKLRQMM